MANDKVTAARAVPRTLVKEFVNHKYMTLMCLGLLMVTVMGFASLMNNVLSGSLSSSLSVLFTIPDAMVLVGTLFCAVCLFRVKQNPTEKILKTTVIACAVYVVLQVMNAYMRGVTIYTIHMSLINGEMGDVGQEVVDMWNASLPYYIWTVVLSVFRGLSFWMMSRAANDMRMMTTGRFPDRNAPLPASILMALTAGMVMCTMILGVMTSGGDVVNLVVTLLSLTPELLFYFAGSQLWRYVSLRRRGEI